MESFEMDREYKRGSWDLRKIERRKNQISIDFPERRRSERRDLYKDRASLSASTILEIDSP